MQSSEERGCFVRSPILGQTPCFGNQMKSPFCSRAYYVKQLRLLLFREYLCAPNDGAPVGNVAAEEAEYYYGVIFLSLDTVARIDNHTCGVTKQTPKALNICG